MSELSRPLVEQAIRNYQDPYLKRDLIAAGAVESIEIEGGKVRVAICLSYPAGGLCNAIGQLVSSAISNLDGVTDTQVNVRFEVAAHPGQHNLEALQSVKNVVAVASGKGGVGKSTTAVNLALALSAEGARVGILDADIYGPSLGLMLGIAEGTRPQVRDQKWFVPVEAQGLKLMSMAFLTDDRTPVVWRGPMASGALQQLMTQTEWGELDYLVVDMPPGTGDIQLTLSQQVPLAGAVIVTTPQDLALLDAKKGVEMFNKVNVPVLGIVENMAVHICSQCGHAEHLFGEGGGTRIADLYDTDLLASMPLSMSIREQVDKGQPTVAAEPDGQLATLYREVARQVGATLALRAEQAVAAPTISINED
ncbi:iron-sulfur cluster carrier protein ApbC [Aestuariirhabdus litorea]|uniref:Iron-sulfur cluster carrier protein n=1 Tax=Aestuariirhabdus litorea TaxID=2528527 RepID=A0A3P3VQQ0_9GAMM|nr:iron-sulfur cluster carrier protein ApbC [Aestuariirhabdus litorea]RRJ85121.1 iron-sulfur cluster carrier protein ApbC [Aestuariirhabdus litorea]RWW98346.1 iron-sulfur cluster carrier protein ApbC [Endozoicomonadaceae bacterium GTF-13]